MDEPTKEQFCEECGTVLGSIQGALEGDDKPLGYYLEGKGCVCPDCYQAFVKPELPKPVQLLDETDTLLNRGQTVFLGDDSGFYPLTSIIGIRVNGHGKRRNIVVILTGGAGYIASQKKYDSHADAEDAALDLARIVANAQRRFK